MKLRTLSVVVVVLAVLSAAVYFLNRPAPPPSADPRVGQPLVDAATVEKSAGLRLSDQGKTVTVTRQSDGTWRVSSYHDLPADFEKLSRFTGELTEARLKRLVTSNPERIARLEFKDSKVELLDATGKPVWSVGLGKHAESGSGRYVRFGDESKAFLADLNAWLDVEPKNWAQAQLLTIKPEDIAAIELPLADGTVVKASRAKKDEAWTATPIPDGQKLRTERLNSAVSSLTSLRFSDTFDPSDANAATAKQQVRNYTLTTFDGKTVTIALGRKPEEKKPKPPAPPAATESTPPAQGAAAETAKTDAPAAAPGTESSEKAAAETKSAEPEFETIPAGPVFAFVSHSDVAAPVNALMQKRAVQIGDYVYTGLPQTTADLFEAAPPPPAPPTATAPVAPAVTPSTAAEKAAPEAAAPAPNPTKS